MSVGPVWGSNPRPPAQQTGDSTNLANQTAIKIWKNSELTENDKVIDNAFSSGTAQKALLMDYLGQIKTILIIYPSKHSIKGFWFCAQAAKNYNTIVPAKCFFSAQNIDTASESGQKLSIV